MKIYVGLIERGCPSDEYIENVYVGTNRKLAIQKINEVDSRNYGCNYGNLETWENGERIEVVNIR